jgi:putative membrane protein
MNQVKSTSSKNYTTLVVTLSIIVNAVILLLFFAPIGYGGEVDFDIHIFPRVNAVLNSFTFIFLLVALFAIMKKNVTLHKRFILAAFTTTILFCVSYLTYHYLSGETTRYGGEGFLRTAYFFILITHSFLAAIIVPLALFSLIWGWTGQLTKHRKIVRWSMPIWLYVSFTGVVVYLMISPYYS